MDTIGMGALVSFLIGWFAAQFCKVVADFVKGGRITSGKELVDLIMKSGGMPSSHTASFLSLTIYFGMQCGFGSGLFALSFCTAMVVIYDAVNVRYAVGEQGKLLNIMVMDNNYSIKKVKVIEGHTVSQVIAGGILGIIIGVLMGLAF